MAVLCSTGSSRLRFLPALLWMIAVTSFLIGQASAQNLVAVSSTPGSPDGDFKIIKRVDEVNLRFTVTDKGGHFNNTLSREDFDLLDNHLPPLGIHYFQQESTLPMRVAILIDVSSSVTNQFKFEQKAASVFLQKMLRPGVDEAFLVTFNDKAHLLQDWSSDPKTAFKKIHELHAEGDTALYDAVIYAAEKLRTHPTDLVTRPVIILITDGDDNASKSIMYDAQQAAARAEAILFALSTNQLSAEYYPRGEAVLDLLSRSTGGRILSAHDTSQLSHAFAQVETTLHSEYIIGYQPADLKLDGSFRVVEILPHKGNLHVHSRRGYYAPLETNAKNN